MAILSKNVLFGGTLQKDGKLANKILDVRIPLETMDLLGLEKLLREAE